MVIEHLDALSYEDWLIWMRYFGLQLARDDNAFLVTLVERRVGPTTPRFSVILRDCGLAAHIGLTRPPEFTPTVTA